MNSIPFRNPQTVNLIAIRKSPEIQGQRSAEVAAVENYLKLHGLPKPLYWVQTVAEAMKLGSVIVAARFADLFTKPSEVAPLLMDALSRGKSLHCVDIGELASVLPLLRVVSETFAVVEREADELARRSKVREFEHAEIVRQVATLAFEKAAGMAIGKVAADALREAEARVQLNSVDPATEYADALANAQRIMAARNAKNSH